MKKVISLCLALFILFATMPVVHATDSSVNTHEELINLACEVYPEYANKIRNQKILPSSHARSSEPPELIYSDSRDTSNGGTLLYSEYSNGVILLTNYTPKKEVTVVDSNTGAGATAYTINISATCSGTNGTFTAKNVKYTTISSSYDRIDSVGTHDEYTPEMNGYIACSLQNVTPNPYVVMNESASGNARLTYKLIFKYAPYANCFVATELTLSVGHNSATVTHVET